MRGTEPLKKLAFSVQEYRRRVEGVQQIMEARGLDALVVSDLANICYLSGFQTIGSYGYGTYALLVGQSGDPTLFVSDFESHNTKIGSWLDDVVVYDIHEQVTGSPVSQAVQLVNDRGYGSARIGCEQGHFALTVQQFCEFSGGLNEAHLVDAGDLVEQVKIIKSPKEISVMRRAAELSTAGAIAGIAAAGEGKSDNDVAAAVYSTVVQGGGEYFSLQPIVTSGQRSGIPHSTFRRNKLQRGDCVFMEVSAAYERYSAPTLRTISIGPPSDEVRRAFDGCIASVNTLIDNIRHGVGGREVARRAGQALRAIAPKLVWHGYYGYSVGLGFPPMCNDCPHEGVLTEAAELVLQTGMTLHCSTSLRKVGEFGVTVSETVLVTDTGCEVLTNVPRELAVRQ